MSTKNGSPLVLLHGFLSDHRLWDGVVRQLDKQIRVIAPDLPGFGGQPPLTDSPSIDALADYVVTMLDQQVIDTAFIVGMSMGGYVALSLAERHPQRLAGLGLISTCSEADTPAKRRLRGVTVAAIHRRGLNGILGEFLPTLFPPGASTSAELVQVATDAVHRSDPAGACWALEAMGARPDRTRLLSTLRVRSIVIHGAEDQVMPIQSARDMAAALPGATFVEIPKVGHATPWEAPEILAESLSKWILT